MSNFVSYKYKEVVDFDEIRTFYKYSSGRYFQIRFEFTKHSGYITWSFDDKQEERNAVYNYLHHQFVRMKIDDVDIEKFYEKKESTFN